MMILYRDFCEDCDSTDEENENFDDAAGESQIQLRNISPKNAVPSGKWDFWKWIRYLKQKKFQVSNFFMNQFPSLVSCGLPGAS